MCQRRILFCSVMLLAATIYCSDIKISIEESGNGISAVISPESLDMGIIRPETTKSMFIFLKNNSADEILIENWRSPCVCLEFKDIVNVLSPGEEKKIVAELNGENYRGPFSKHMLISFRNKQGNAKKTFFLPIRFTVQDDDKSIVAPQPAMPSGNRINFVDYAGDAIDKYKDAEAWIFAGKSCPNCEQLKREILPKLLSLEGIDKAKIVLADLDKKENFMFMIELEDKLGSKGEKTPVLLWRNKMYYGNEKIKELISDRL